MILATASKVLRVKCAMWLNQRLFFENSLNQIIFAACLTYFGSGNLITKPTGKETKSSHNR